MKRLWVHFPCVNSFCDYIPAWSDTPSPSKSGPIKHIVTSEKCRQKSLKDIQNSPSSFDFSPRRSLVSSSTHVQLISLKITVQKTQMRTNKFNTLTCQPFCKCQRTQKRSNTNSLFRIGK